MNTKPKTNRCRKSLTIGLISVAILTTPVHAATFFVPSFIIGVLSDDNVFISANDRQKDLITRITPALAAGYESERLQLGASYSQDLEAYKDNPELDATDMRQYATAELLYRLSELVIFSVDASFTKSRIPAELNISSGIGEGRIEGERSIINPALSYRLSERSRAQLDYTHTIDNLAGGTEGETNALNVEYEHALTPNTQMTYGYTYTHFAFDNPQAGVLDLNQSVHTPRVGIIHNFSPNTILLAQAGPSYSDDDVGANIAVLLRRRYINGQFSVGYDRSASSLIGEPGLVEINVLNASMTHDFTNNFSVNIMASYSEVSRNNAFFGDSDISRASFSAQYRVNLYTSVEASFSHSNQRLAFQNIPRNVAMLALTLSYPRRSEPALVNR